MTSDSRSDVKGVVWSDKASILYVQKYNFLCPKYVDYCTLEILSRDTKVGQNRTKKWVNSTVLPHLFVKGDLAIEIPTSVFQNTNVCGRPKFTCMNCGWSTREPDLKFFSLCAEAENNAH